MRWSEQRHNAAQFRFRQVGGFIFFVRSPNNYKLVHGDRREGTKQDVASLVIVALPTRVAVSSYRGWKQADVDVKSHPQKLDMSGDSEFSTQACIGSEAVCLFILGTFLLSACLDRFHALSTWNVLFFSVWSPPVAAILVSLFLSLGLSTCLFPFISLLHFCLLFFFTF